MALLAFLMALLMHAAPPQSESVTGLSGGMRVNYVQSSESVTGLSGGAKGHRVHHNSESVTGLSGG